jgi:hypothetical protein
MNGATIRTLAAMGLTLEQIAEVADTEDSGPDKTARQARNQRYYEARKRLKASEKRLNSDAELGVLKASESVLKRLNSDAALARVDDNSSLREISGKKKNKQYPSNAAFDAFWKAYPRKVGKGAAWKAYKRAQTRATQTEIMAGLSRAPAGKAWAGGYIPHPATWLNEDRWLDEPETTAAILPFAIAEPKKWASEEERIEARWREQEEYERAELSAHGS